MDIMEIKKIRPSPRLDSDFLAWAPEKSGLFLVKNAYRLAYDDLYGASMSSSSTNTQGAGYMESTWSTPLPPKGPLFWLEACNKYSSDLEQQDEKEHGCFV